MDYSKKTLAELKKICQEQKIKGYSGKNKNDTIKLLMPQEDIPINDVNVSAYIANNSKIHIPKPILKWVGGKTQILDKLIVEFPTNINNYHEIFLGGGSVLLTLLSYVKAGKINISGAIYAYDLNEPLIYVYKNIQSRHEELYLKIQELIAEFNQCVGIEINRKPISIIEAKKSKENYYYWIRTKYNNLTDLEQNSITGSAMFIFLNKTCFRGVFRLGPNGFNVPYGHYKNAEIINKLHLDEIHTLIQGVIFDSCDFIISLNNIVGGDFTYLDPPYAPETANSFVGYTDKGFSITDHNQLFRICHKFTNQNKKLMMSNAAVKLIADSFPAPLYNTSIIPCRRAINSKDPSAITNEVIIKNF